MKQCVLALILVVVAVVTAQGPTLTKPGDCPPPFIGSCGNICLGDTDCPGQQKCCTTSCAGSMCIMPVTMRNSKIRTDKPGHCPARPTGSWICSNTCRYDNDCRGRLKCCSGRCPRSMICVKPEI